MKQSFKGWDAVLASLSTVVAEQHELEKAHGPAAAQLNVGQRASLVKISTSLATSPGMIIADEVGMGKTRIAVALAKAVINAGGRVAILVPPGLGFQWQKALLEGGLSATGLVRSLAAYQQAWQPQGQGKEAAPWFEQPVVLVSHGLTNWRLGDAASAWRWGLLPELLAQWRKKTRERLPNGYKSVRRGSETDSYKAMQDAARDIANATPIDETHPGWRRLTQISEAVPWSAGVWDSASYGNREDLRKPLQQAVGMGLGVFDLIIADEAHRNRAPESALSALLGTVMLAANDARRLVLTATPVELNAKQWQDILSRIGLDPVKVAGLSQIIEEYAAAALRLRQVWRTSEAARLDYARLATIFKQELAPFLVRRDKREDETVRLFQRHTGRPLSDYREQREIVVETEKLAPAWRQAVCVAESLSLVARQSTHGMAKRLRLTLANGHGIACLMDQIRRIEADGAQEKDDEIQSTQDTAPAGRAVGKVVADNDDKRAARAKWWLNALGRVFDDGGESLFDHPAIQAAVEAIEEVTQQGGKVLVFGRFSIPMHALTALLNAREMLRRIEKDLPWPQAKVHLEEWKVAHQIDELSALRAAQLQLGTKVDFAVLDDLLKQRYESEQGRRETVRKHLLETLEHGMQALEPAQKSAIYQVFLAFCESEAQWLQMEIKKGPHPSVLIARALSDLLGEADREHGALAYAQAFCELFDAMGGQNEENDDADQDKVQRKRWEVLWQRLQVEYNNPEGGFARLMVGATRQPTRRLLQAAFNRQYSYPKVLVAQSLVGREGLDLHKACRTVVLLHPEWNPGVVEQQIGRVDRLGSQWGTDVRAAIEAGVSAEAIPRITIRPVIFRGTYDEYNWEVLQQRWDDLRAQLHGVVIPPRLVEAEYQALAQELTALAPSFSPGKS
ncbi:type III restriction endonuclease subunit R [Janthinobacterium sp. HSC-3S05]|uniref:helicase-related protein n=1 Tax=Janthinobacterium lividum TaxID=29581 RepID=UPI001CD8DF51|nr:helicase-related protein [Janthinobacterium lividum]MCA1861183.1 type III restriction endonuclease subunit R [Janthinobacterium lividum]